MTSGKGSSAVRGCMLQGPPARGRCMCVCGGVWGICPRLYPRVMTNGKSTSAWRAVMCNSFPPQTLLQEGLVLAAVGNVHRVGGSQGQGREGRYRCGLRGGWQSGWQSGQRDGWQGGFALLAWRAFFLAHARVILERRTTGLQDQSIVVRPWSAKPPSCAVQARGARWEGVAILGIVAHTSTT
eukprot:363427-Chlamydomonas_euryale.AAC.6